VLIELHGKGGSLCRQAKAGQIHCPLIIRPTSEDAITGDLVHALRCINSYWWLPDLLNAAVGACRFRRQVHRRLKIEPWVNMPPYPRELLPWDEGGTQVDLCISWENPPTTVFVEAKYGSKVAEATANGDGTQGYPADQLVRNIRVGLLGCGYFDAPGSLFAMPSRDFVMVLLAPRHGHPLVERYRDVGQLRAAIPHADRLVGLPRPPFVGELSYAHITRVLASNARFLTRAERQIVGDLTTYLQFKQSGVPSRPTLQAHRPATAEVPETT
jgi:hypothetical protein